jgi:uncharacterized membrane protein
LVPVAVVDVVHVPVLVPHRLMSVGMGVRLARLLVGSVLVPVMFVVRVLVLVFELFVAVQVLVAVLDEQERTEGHDPESRHPRCGQGLA